jgi:hypothetical protein
MIRAHVLGALAITGATVRSAAADPGPDGVGVSVSAGALAFTGPTMRETASPGGLWDLRVVLGTRAYLAVEGAYVGTAQAVEAPLGGRDAALVGTTFEVVARSNFGVRDLQPYGFLGAGWTHYTVTEPFDMADSGMNPRDDVLVFPMGLGVAYYRGSLIVDVRATGRLVSQPDLVLAVDNPLGRSYAAMHTFGISAGLGVEFW